MQIVPTAFLGQSPNYAIFDRHSHVRRQRIPLGFNPSGTAGWSMSLYERKEREVVMVSTDS